MPWLFRPDFLDVLDQYTLFCDTHMIACTRTGTHTSKFACPIYYAHKIKVFSLFVFLLHTFRKEKLFIEGFLLKITYRKLKSN